MPRRMQRREPPRPAGDQTWAPYCRFPAAMSHGNHVRLLVDGEEAYPAMLEAIAGARQTVLMDSYIFNADRAGKLFAAALAERALDGVAVYLIVDGMGTLAVPAEFFEGMRSAGIRLLEYRPVAPWRQGWGLLRRDHRKLLVVDGRVGFAGGLNVGDEWLSVGDGGQGWHDIHVRIEGPAVRELAKLARATWRDQGGVDLDPRLFLPEIPGNGPTTARIIGSRERRLRQAIRRSYLHAISRARERIFIANAYFLPGLGFRRALGNAVRRGVDVRVMVPARGDILPVQLASQALYSRLLKAGIRIFLWREAVLHAKSAVVDGQWSTVGSFNIDHRSWAMNLEVNVNVLGAQFATQLEQVFLADQQRCEELTRERWRQRPMLQRLVERFCLLFEKWM